MIAALLRWLREEVRLLGLASWSDGAYAGPPGPHPCTSADPRCAAVIERQAEVRAAMKYAKAGILDGKPITRGADLAATFAAIKRVSAPPVRLIGRRAK